MAEHSHSHDHHHHHDHGDDHGVELAQFGAEAFGVNLAISAPAQVLPRVEGVLPPGWRRREPTEGDHEFALRPRVHSNFRVEDATGGVSGSSDLQVALEVLSTRLRSCVALHAPNHIFIHAGAVGHHGRAIVIPGLSFSGKTTLVTELVKAGATYYSDEFAVLDDEGRVHPYLKPLSIRSGGYSQVDHDIESIGGVAGDAALPVGLVAIAEYVKGGRWEPRRLSGGEAVLGLLANAVPAQERPERTLAAIRRAVDGAVVLQGQRGEAAELAPALLSAVATKPQSLPA